MSSVNCDVSLSAATTDPSDVRGTVAGHSGSIMARIQQLRGVADGLRGTAEGVLQSVSDLEMPDSETISFEAALSQYARAELSFTGKLPSLYRDPSIDSASLDDPPSVDVDSFIASGIQDAPTVPEFSFPAAPTPPSVGGAPRAPDVDMPDIPDPPADFHMDLQSLPEVAGLPPLAMDFPEIETVEIATPDWADIPMPDTAVLDQYQQAVGSMPDVEDYDPRIVQDALCSVDRFLMDPDLVSTTAMDTVLRMHVQEEAIARHTNRLAGLWDRRGLGRHDRADRRDAVTEHGSRVAQRQGESWDALIEAGDTRRWMQLLPGLLRQAVDTHSFLVDQRIQFADIEMEVLSAEKEAQAGLYALAAARYNIAISEIETEAAKYRAQVETVRAKVVTYAAFVDQQQNKARLNRARADAYVAQQDAKVARTAEFEAYVDAAKAVVRAYNALMRGVQARAQAVGAQLARFEAESAQWQAELVSVRSQYSTRRAENQAIVAENRAAAATVSAEVGQAEAVAMASRQSAAEVASEAAQLRAQIASGLADTAGTALNNSQSALRYKAGVLDYRIDAAQHNTENLSNIVDNAAIEQINSTLPRQAEAITSAVGRAAELTQRYQTQLAQAYVELASTLADAEAARVSGEVAPYRASTSLSARGDVSYRSRADLTQSSSSDYSSSGSNTCRTIFREARM